MATRPSLFERMYASPQMAAQRAAAAQLSSSMGQQAPQWAQSYEGYQKSSLMDRMYSSPQMLAGQAAAQQMLVGAGLQAAPATLGAGGAPSTGGGLTLGAGAGAGTGTGGAGTAGGSADILDQLYAARPKLLQQQTDMLNQFGPSSRQAIFAASPELAAASQHILGTFSDPFGGALSTFQDAIRSAQAARGFTGGGTGPVGEEARYLTNYAMQRRDQLLPQAAAFGQQMLDIGGLSSSGMYQLGNLALQQQQLQAQVLAGQQQSSWAQQMYNQQMGDLQNAQLQQLIQQYMPTSQKRPGGYQAASSMFNSWGFGF